MTGDIEIIAHPTDRSTTGEIILRATCPFCNCRATFRKINEAIPSNIKGYMIPLLCEGCNSVVIISLSDNKLYPTSMVKGLEGLPEEIDKYYQEALRCMSADSPNCAVTLFRKTIHAIGIYYGIANIDDNKKLFEIIKKLEDDGHITPKIKNALDGIRDIGNDGAHINKNEPDMSQALILKKLIDMTLNSTVLSDQNLETINNIHKKKAT